jgi:hypothetical protein
LSEEVLEIVAVGSKVSQHLDEYAAAKQPGLPAAMNALSDLLVP